MIPLHPDDETLVSRHLNAIADVLGLENVDAEQRSFWLLATINHVWRKRGASA